MPRHRGTPAKDWLVPDVVKALPFLPAIESAYAQGYRRMVIDPHYSRDVVENFEDVLFLGGAWGHDVAHIALTLVEGYGPRSAEVLGGSLPCWASCQYRAGGAGRSRPTYSSAAWRKGRRSARLTKNTRRTCRQIAPFAGKTN